jgi:tetratricopeptide (TPR) repeat protein
MQSADRPSSFRRVTPAKAGAESSLFMKLDIGPLPRRKPGRNPVIENWTPASAGATDLHDVFRGSLAACALLLGACASAPPAVPAQPANAPASVAAVPARAQDRFEQALSFMDKDLGRAEQALTALTRDYPDLAGPWVNLGILHARGDRAADAEAAFSAALERNPQHAAAHNELGILYRQSGRFAEAASAYAAALAADPDYALAWFNRGVLNDLYLQRPDAALGDYQRYQALQPDADERVAKWITDLKLRIEARTAQAADR